MVQLDSKSPKGIAASVVIALLMSVILAVLPSGDIPAQAAIASNTFNNGDCNLPNGTGTRADPFLIGTADELWEVSDCLGIFELQNSIDAITAVHANTTSPIGNPDLNPQVYFGKNGSVELDGNGFSVSFSISQNSAGLFAKIDNVTISNLILVGNVTSTATSSVGCGPTAAGALTPETGAAGITRLVSVTNSVTVTGHTAVGGLIGCSSGSVEFESVLNQGDVSAVTGGGIVGGFVGDVRSNILVVSSQNQGTVSAPNDVGGFFGILKTGKIATVSHAINAGPVTATGPGSVGGLAGNSQMPLSVTQFVNNAQVNTAGAYSGGVAGYVAADLVIRESTNAGTVSSVADYAGGLVGYMAAGKALTISGVINRGPISASSYVAGLVGYALSPVTVFSSSNRATISATSDYVGGGFGLAKSRLHVTDFSNLGKISTNADYAGGVSGYTDDITEFLRVANYADIRAYDYAGGLIGKTEEATTISNSLNSGSVSAGTAGGMVGQVGGATHFENVSNIADVDAPNDTRAAGGFIGWSNGNVNLVFGLNLGIATGDPTFTDGLIGRRSTAATVATRTSQSSSLQSSSSLVELQTISTFTGWNFSTVWGIPDCSINNGAPVLRWANPGLTFYDLSCGLNSTPNSNHGNQGQPSSTPSQPPAQYTGPTVLQTLEVVYRGDSVSLRGQKLDSVYSLLISSVELEVLQQSSTSLDFRIPPSVSLGVQDLVLLSSFGSLTVMQVFDVRERLVLQADFGELLGYQWVSRYEGNSRTLHQAQVSGIESALGSFESSTTVICWGYTTASAPNAWAIAHATQRAKAACNLVAQLSSEVKTTVRVRYGVKKQFAMRASLQFWERKPAP